MSGLLIPVSMVVVGHDGDPVEIPGETRHVVANINDLLAWGDCGGQQQPAGLKGGTEGRF